MREHNVYTIFFFTLQAVLNTFLKKMRTSPITIVISGHLSLTVNQFFGGGKNKYLVNIYNEEIFLLNNIL